MDLNKKKTYYIKIVLLSFFVCFLILSFFDSHKQLPYSKLIIHDLEIPVEVADTAETRRMGLSYRESLDKDSGMLFDMKKRAESSFWMKDMNFALDIVWIDGEKIVNISKNLPPEGNQPDMHYSSEFPIDYVLEVNDGFCEKNNINIGDNIIFHIR